MSSGDSRLTRSVTMMAELAGEKAQAAHSQRELESVIV